MRRTGTPELIVLSLVALLVTTSWTFASAVAAQQEQPLTGMDQTVNKNLAEDAGLPARSPYINTEANREIWNLILLVGGAICGFVIGRRWDRIFGRKVHSQKHFSFRDNQEGQDHVGTSSASTRGGGSRFRRES